MGNLCKELIGQSGEFVVLHYKETFFGFPRDTHYQVTGFDLSNTMINNSNLVNSRRRSGGFENKDAFCSLLGSIYEDKITYEKVKALLKKKNLYLFKKLETCNKP